MWLIFFSDREWSWLIFWGLIGKYIKNSKTLKRGLKWFFISLLKNLEATKSSQRSNIIYLINSNSFYGWLVDCSLHSFVYSSVLFVFVWQSFSEFQKLLKGLVAFDHMFHPHGEFVLSKDYCTGGVNMTNSLQSKVFSMDFLQNGKFFVLKCFSRELSWN